MIFSATDIAAGSPYLSRLRAGLSHMALWRLHTCSGLMVRDAPQAALLTMRVRDFAAKQDLILRSPPKAGVSKDGPQRDRSPCSFPYAIALPASGRGSAPPSLLATRLDLITFSFVLLASPRLRELNTALRSLRTRTT